MAALTREGAEDRSSGPSPPGWESPDGERSFGAGLGVLRRRENRGRENRLPRRADSRSAFRLQPQRIRLQGEPRGGIPGA